MPGPAILELRPVSARLEDGAVDGRRRRNGGGARRAARGAAG
jgi:hypothetical protein